MSNHATRLNKFIAESGYCSRRQADIYIAKGQVKINQRKAVIGDLVFPGNRVMVNGFALDPKEASKLVFIALNKPTGITSTTEANVEGNIVHFVHHPERIFPIGRLDKDSQGLIFLTNDGDIVNKILRAGNRHEKEYVVTVDKPLAAEALQTMSQGVPMLGTTTKKCRITQVGPSTFKIILIQGLNRQIRRMCEYVGLQVIKLERTRIMHVSLGILPLGEWRDLTPNELESIYTAVEASSSEVTVRQKSPAQHRTPVGGVAKKKPALKTQRSTPEDQSSFGKSAGFKGGDGRPGKSQGPLRGPSGQGAGGPAPKGKGGRPGRRR